MSNFLSIATVSATLRRTLQAAVDRDVPGANVRTVRPDGAGNNAPARGVNIFLYQVTPNAAWRNADLPTRGGEGELVQRPRVALNLHYLLAFFGDEGQLEPQQLLGCVVRTLHSRPVLTRQMIQDTLADPLFSFLAASDLADEVEQVKFAPESLSLEELSKLWSIMLQTPYALSIAYQGTVVLIDSRQPPRAALPVRARNIYVVPFRQPVIDLVRSEAGRDQPITAASTLILEGQRLRGDVTQVRVAGEVLPAQDVSDTQASIPLAAVPAASLRAGVQGVQVVHPMMMGTPPVEHRGVESNVAAFVLRPAITAVDSQNEQALPGGLRSADIVVTLSPRVGQTQRVMLLLNELNPPPGETPLAYTFGVRSRGQPAPTDTITIPVTGVKAATYAVRVQVDGAESLLEVDANGLLSQPQVTIQ